MKHSTGSLTKSDKERFLSLTLIGCIACRFHGKYRSAEIHHLLSGNKRRGHEYTIPLCRFHHQGDPDFGWTANEMAQRIGPSLARESKAFHIAFGSDDELLERVNELIKETKL